MASSSSMFLLALVVVAALLRATAAETFNVGDDRGWMIPGGDANFYSSWADGKTFRVGDVLFFNFSTGVHDVAHVRESEYTACTANSPIGNILNQGPATINLNQTGLQYYICAVTGHCLGGQKLSINVVAASGSTPAGGPAPPPESGNSPGSSNAAPSFTAPLGFIGIAAAFFAFFL